MGRGVPFLVALTVGLAVGARAQAGPAGLGRIDFPATASPEAHQEFVTGVLWMHSFEYPRAAAAFQRAQRLEPGFAMAYWGEAMTHTHAIWNEQDAGAARAVLARLAPDAAARRARAPTEREKMYLDAVEALYGEGAKPRRDTLYAEAMERLVRAQPADLEAKAFYALSLLGLNQGVRDTATYRRAAAWADTVFAANPEHPGGAHYLIHAWDDPRHAHLGLAAARAYIGIAPGAAHAQHMTTHIFLALGMWPEVVAQNTVAVGLTSRLPGHYTSWLHYGLLQQGRIGEATAFLEELRDNMLTQRARASGILAWMRLAHVLTTDQWDDGPALWTIDAEDLPGAQQVPELYFRGLLAHRMRNPTALDSALSALQALRDELQAADATDPALGGIAVQVLELTGLRRALAGRLSEAIATVRRAVAMEESLPVEFGPPVITQPSPELLGALLEATDPAGAMRAYQRSLALAPRRSLSLLGLARSARAAGNQRVARQAADEWRAISADADPEWKLLLPPVPPGTS